ncbi:MAG: hypothetical protein EZS26_000342 [Candidatus Ordinivivax streblomastigis]|uniref:Lipoprotein n=1 Tax=Candidatus Ordinivivax streblomastigis TaxID=2540710 RepID=A0A5M8P5T3_9BACT|nr:MAG: hypothetical protein EZS26_000342 [Candidatus Ordinivivax streblomastigis]
MKKKIIGQFSAFLLIMSIFAGCSTTRDCGCGNNQSYKKRKTKISLIISPENTTFVSQKDLS